MKNNDYDIKYILFEQHKLLCTRTLYMLPSFTTPHVHFDLLGGY